jgi:hypothetical protein
MARLLLVAEVLLTPDAIVSGWGRPDRDDCFVYVGRPSRDYRRISIETTPPPNQLFLVFVLPDGTIDDWNWRIADAADPSKPEGMKGHVIWPTT